MTASRARDCLLSGSAPAVERAAQDAVNNRCLWEQDRKRTIREARGTL